MSAHKRVDEMDVEASHSMLCNICGPERVVLASTEGQHLPNVGNGLRRGLVFARGTFEPSWCVCHDNSGEHPRENNHCMSNVMKMIGICFALSVHMRCLSAFVLNTHTHTLHTHEAYAEHPHVAIHASHHAPYTAHTVRQTQTATQTDTETDTDRTQ